MSAIVFPKSEGLVIVNAIVALAAFVGAKLHLFSNNITPTPSNVLADFTECVYSGYAAQTVTWSPAFYDINGVPVSSGGEVLFAQSGATGDFCYGAFLTDSAGTHLLWAGNLDSPPFTFVNTGDTLPLVIKMGGAGRDTRSGTGALTWLPRPTKAVRKPLVFSVCTHNMLLGVFFMSIATSLLRATFFFQDTNKHGWSEGLHNVATTDHECMKQAIFLYPKRIKLNGDTASLTYIRTSDDLVKRDSNVTHISAFDGTPGYFAETPSEIANTALVIRIETALDTVRRTLYMSGIPDEIVTQAGKFAPTPAWQSSFNDWVQQLILGGWALKGATRCFDPGAHNWHGGAYPSGQVTVTALAPHGLAVNGIAVMATTGIAALNGPQKVVSVPSRVDVYNQRVNRDSDLPGWGHRELARLQLVPSRTRKSFALRTGTAAAPRLLVAPTGQNASIACQPVRGWVDLLRSCYQITMNFFNDQVTAVPEPGIL